MYRHSSQEVCPWNVRLSFELPDESPVHARQAFAGKDVRTLARELLTVAGAVLRILQGSPMKRAKLRRLKRNAALVLGNIGNSEDVDVLIRALDDPEPLVRGHAAWVLERIGSSPLA